MSGASPAFGEARGEAVRKAHGPIRRQARSQARREARAAQHPRRHGHTHEGRDDIRKAQAALNRQGFDVGTPDGKLGRRTKQALIAFQKQRGFRTTGKADGATLQALLAAGTPPGSNQDNKQPSVQASPTGTVPLPPARVPALPATTGQGNAPAAASPQPAGGDAAQPTEGDAHPPPDLQVPDSGASGRVPSGAPQQDYKDDTTPPAGSDQR